MTGLRSPAAEARLLACVHCGFCLPACPTYVLLGDENDSPRGRLYLMRAFAEGRIGAEGALTLHLGRCLGCRACELVCPAGVEFGALLETGREELRAADPARGRGGRRLAAWLLRAVTGGAGSRALFALARVLRAALPARLAARLPGRAGLAARLLLATRPAGSTARAAAAAAPPATGRAAPAAAPAAAEPAPRFALLDGCVMRGLFGHVHAAARRTLAAAGYREAAAPGQRCCGALHAHAGDMERARRLARANLEAFERSGAGWIVSDSAGCGAALREYPRWLEEEPEWGERARRVAARVRDVSELLADPPRPLRGRLPGRLAYDAPCHLAHAQRVGEAPLRMLAAVEGLVVTPLPSSDRCCGGAGIWNLLEPGLAEEIVRRKVEEVRTSGADAVVTGNPGCVMQIGAALAAAGVPARALHPVEALDRALARESGAAADPAGAGGR